MIPTKLEMLRGQVKLRGDAGPTGRLAGSALFLRVDGKIYPISSLVTGPPIIEEQLVIRSKYDLTGELLELNLSAICEPLSTGDKPELAGKEPA